MLFFFYSTFTKTKEKETYLKLNQVYYEESSDRFMFTEDFFKTHTQQKQEDVWMHLLLQLHVPSNYVDNRNFKVASIDLLRKSTVYKNTKLSAVVVEDNLVNSTLLSISSFCALATLFHVNIAVILGNVYIPFGTPTHYVSRHYTLRPIPSSNFNDLLQVHCVGKPLNAVSYYSASDLENIVAKLHMKKGSKTFMYNGIQHYLQKKINGSKQ